MTKEEFLKYLDKNCISDPNNIHYVEKSPLELPFDSLKFVGKGIFNTVYKARIGEESWIIKEGAYDLKVPLFKNIYLPLPRKSFDRLYKMIGISLMPSHKSAIDQLQEYVLLSRYFGYFADGVHDHIIGFDPQMKVYQHQVRERLRESIMTEDDFAEVILGCVKTFKNYHKIKELILDDDFLNYQFLPKEYLVLSITSERKSVLKLFSRKVENHYIIQDCVDGHTLGKTHDKDLFDNKKALSRLIIFILLSLTMAYYENKLIDSRPEGILSGDWFGETGNIIVHLNDGDIKFVDTRWLNQQEGTILQKGIVISDLIRDALSKNLLKYIEAL